jgi:hypothetical protein
MAVSEEMKEICAGIESLGDAYLQKHNQLAKRLDEIELGQAKSNTSFGGIIQQKALRDEIGQALTTNDVELKAFLNGDRKHLKIETKTVGDMLIGTHLTGGTASVSMPPIGPVGMDYRLTNVRDLLRRVSMSTGYLPLLKDNGGEGTIAPVAEGSLKNALDFDLAEGTAKAETIAGTTTVSKQFFDDVQNAQTWLQDRLVELYNASEADELLNGDGNSPNLKGLNTSGNFTAATGTSQIHAEQLIQGLLQMRILKRRPSGIIINPANLESLILNKAVGGSEEYNLPSVVSMSPIGQLMAMGVPVVDIAEQPEDTFTIHDATGSLYAVRQGITIEFFDQTYATTNKILIRIEARIAFPNFGASYTVKGSFYVPES